MPIIIDQLRAEAEAAAALHGVTGEFGNDATVWGSKRQDGWRFRRTIADVVSPFGQSQA